MRKISYFFFLIFAISIFSCDRQEESKWVKIDEDDEFVLKVDKSSKVNMGKGIYRYWLRTDFTEKGRAKEQRERSLSREPLYLMACIEIRCDYKDFHLTGSSFYDSDGKVIRSDTMTEEGIKKAGWMPIAPETRGATIHETLCK